MYSKIYAHLSMLHWPVIPIVFIPKERKVSLCCGAYPPGGTMELNSTGRCPLCGDNCEFVSLDELKELNATVKPVIVDADLPVSEARLALNDAINRLEESGPSAVSNAELVSIITGISIESARKVVSPGLFEMAGHSLKALAKYEGMTRRKAITLSAVLELARRKQIATAVEKPYISTSADIANYLQAKLRDNVVEVFAVIYLNLANKVVAYEEISRGGITGTVADPRVILKKALESNAVNIVLSHNHPSGSLKPSRADEELTKKIKQSAILLDIQVLDHIIVSDQGYYSFSDEGLI